MSRIAARFRELRARGERALVPFLMAGDPDLAATERLVPALAEAGADLIEIGVPFSDPIAEGPTIQRATQRALASGTRLRRVLDLVARLRERVDLPLVLMGYANNFLTFGGRDFARVAGEVGVDGVIVVDLPPEEGAELFEPLRAADVDPILLAAPTTAPERLLRLARETRGFLYYVSLTGVTGARSELAATLEQEVRRARDVCPVPVCVGFGVSTAAHAREIGGYADGVVVGSALVDRLAAASGPQEAVRVARDFVAELKAPLREPPPPAGG